MTHKWPTWLSKERHLPLIASFFCLLLLLVLCLSATVHLTSEVPVFFHVISNCINSLCFRGVIFRSLNVVYLSHIDMVIWSLVHSLCSYTTKHTKSKRIQVLCIALQLPSPPSCAVQFLHNSSLIGLFLTHTVINCQYLLNTFFFQIRFKAEDTTVANT